MRPQKIQNNQCGLENEKKEERLETLKCQLQNILQSYNNISMIKN